VSCPNCTCEQCRAARASADEKALKPKLAAAIELLFLAGVDERTIAKAFDMHIRPIRLIKQALVCRAGVVTNFKYAAPKAPVAREPWEQRLIAAGAIPTRMDSYRPKWDHGDWKLLRTELPPDNWPIGTTKRKP